MAKARKPGATPQRVVGIGASAGGLDALKQLVAAIPVDSGLAFVVLQHLPPSQTGLLARLLASASRLKVEDAASGHRIAPNTVIVVPPRTTASLYRGALVLRTSKEGARPRLPIDSLFASLATVLGERSVGVVLSGTAQDGTEGLRAIQAAGGLTFAQEPSTAQFDDMPRNAIAAGVVEAVLPPAAIGEELGVIAKLAPRPSAASPTATLGIDRVLEQLREASGIDFTSYKRTTIERRLARRLSRHHDSINEYSEFLAAHPEEASELYEDLLIHVTEFFRDHETLEKVITRVLPDIVDGKAKDLPVRVWVPGCSTGEEVYSLAMLLLEQIGESGRQIQLFGTDLSERAVDTARQGRYPKSIGHQVSEDRLARFFRPEDGGYRIRREVRERCVFVRHDLVSDPPFSKLDLVSCRNVLIYLGATLQQRVIPIFHYALEQPGYLLLGRAESVAGFELLFEAIDAEARLYARKPAARTTLTFPLAGQLGRLPWRPSVTRSSVDVQRDVDHVLLARYAPACVIVDDNLDVVQFRGRTGPYLEAPPGQPQINLLRMAREGLASELPLAIQRARRSDVAVRRENIVVRDHGRVVRFNLEIVPMRGTATTKRNFLVVFEPITTLATASSPRTGRKRPATKGDVELVRVTQELTATKEYLHSLVAQHLGTTEELGITNEELQSTNEELQSTNEELQTAKEELQSTNEELETVNEELQSGNAALREANDDLVNVLGSVEIAIIIVDLERRVRRFTPKARAVMKLIPTDVGRPIADLKPSVGVPELDTKITDVIESLVVHESEVSHADGTWYRMQIRPYRTADHAINGAVIAFVDITALRAARDYMHSIVETVPTPLVVLNDRLRVELANRAFYAAFHTTPSAVVGHGVLELGEWRGHDLRARLDAVATTGVSFDDVEIELHTRLGANVLRVGARPLPAADRRLILVGIADVTERRRLQQAREAAAQEREAFLDAVSHELRTPLSAIVLWAQVLTTLERDDPRWLEAIDTITQSARSEVQLIDDLLDLALSRTSELAVSVESIEPSSIVGAAIDALRPEADNKQIAIATEVIAGSKVAADPRRLRQITANLIANAIKFTPVGGKISVALAVDNGSMELRVGDSGPGISPEFRAHLFEPFSQADQSRTRAHSGLGIGLALVRHFVERQGGSIDVASPGDTPGTTFTVRIPAPSG